MSEQVLERRGKVERARIIDFGLTTRYGAGVRDLPIRGPLGIWFFPLLNLVYLFLLGIFNRLFSQGIEARPRKRTVIYEIVRDKEGRIIEILEREVSE